MEMRVKHLEKMGEIAKAVVLAKACTECSQISNEVTFRQTYVSLLCHLLPNAEAIAEVCQPMLMMGLYWQHLTLRLHELPSSYLAIIPIVTNQIAVTCCNVVTTHYGLAVVITQVKLNMGATGFSEVGGC